FLKNIHDAGEHLLRLINDVLDLSKVEARRIELHRETIDVDALLAPVRQTALGEAGRRTLHFDADVAPGLAVNVDPLRIRQILLNLISNAAKFTPSGGTIWPRAAQLSAALARHHGRATEVTAAAASAIASIRRRVPIGIVLDLRLPDARGESVLDELHRVSMSGPVPTVIVTVEDDEGATRLNGADDHITKPIDHARLEGWLRQVAARKAASRTGAYTNAVAAR